MHAFIYIESGLVLNNHDNHIYMRYFQCSNLLVRSPGNCFFTINPNYLPSLGLLLIVFTHKHAFISKPMEADHLLPEIHPQSNLSPYLTYLCKSLWGIR